MRRKSKSVHRENPSFEKMAITMHRKANGVRIQLLVVLLAFSLGIPAFAQESRRLTLAERFFQMSLSHQTLAIGQPGVILLEVEPENALGRSGLVPGDVVLAWSRPSSSSQIYVVEDYLDWFQLVENESSRGGTLLLVERGAERFYKMVGSGEWWTPVRPRLAHGDLRKIGTIFARKYELSCGSLGSLFEFLLSEVALSEGNGIWVVTRVLEELLVSGNYSEHELAARDAISMTRELRSKIVLQKALVANLLGTRQPVRARAEIDIAIGYILQLNGPGPQFADWTRIRALSFGLESNWESAHQELAKATNDLEMYSPNSSTLATSLIDYGKSLDYLGREVEAVEVMKRAEKLFEAIDIPASEPLARLRRYTAEALRDLGLDMEARDYYQKALEVYRLIPREAEEVGRMLSALSGIDQHFGDFAEAERKLLASLEVLERVSPGGQSHVITLVNLGVNSMEQGNWARAGIYFYEAEEIGKLKTSNRLLHGIVLCKMANLELHRENWDLAKDMASQALAALQPLGKEFFIAEANNSLGVVALRENNLAVAIERLQDSYGYFSANEPNNGATTEIRENLAVALSTAGRYQEALDLFSKSLGTGQPGSDSLFRLAGTYRDLAELYRRMGRVEDSLNSVQMAIEAYRQTAPDSDDLAAALIIYGNVLIQRTEKKNAVAALREAIEILNRLSPVVGGSYESRSLFRTRASRVLDLLVPLLIELEGAREALVVVEDMKNNLMRLLKRGSRSESPGRNGNRQRHELMSRYRALMAERTLLEGDQQAARRLDQEIATTRLRLGDLDHVYAEEPQLVGEDRLQTELGVGALVISFFVQEDALQVFLLCPDGTVSVRTVNISRSALNSTVEDFIASIVETSQKSTVAGSRAEMTEISGQKIFELLFDGLVDEMAAAQRVVIIPDGILNRLPFGALRVRARNEIYLSLWRPLLFSESLNSFRPVDLGHRTSDSGEHAVSRLVAFGSQTPEVYERSGVAGRLRSDFLSLRAADSRGLLAARPLQYVRSEIEGIAAIYPGTVEVFLDNLATESALFSLSGPVDILHMASHAAADEEYPLSSFISLQPQEESDGVVQAWEIFEKLKIDADLVVLSACETGSGRYYSGEGMVGLTQAFRYAGAKSVLSSLWRVNDEVSAKLMILFYQALASGLPKVEALKYAQSRLAGGKIEIEQPDGSVRLFDASSPYYWAGFQLYGEFE